MVGLLAPTTVTDALTSIAFFFFGLSFITMGGMALGKGDPKGAAGVFTLVGIINGILGFIILGAFGLVGPTAPIYASVGLLVLIFAFTWIVAGIVNAHDYDLMPLGNASILSGLMMLGFAAFFISLGLEGVFTTIGSAWLTICVLSWAWAFWSVTLASHGKIELPVVGWTFLIQAFYTLWIPAVLLLTGVIELLA